MQVRYLPAEHARGVLTERMILATGVPARSSVGPLAPDAPIVGLIDTEERRQGVGWISKRCRRTGHSLYTGGPQRKGPLRKVVRVILAGDGLFSSDWVELECGHETRSYGGVRAICTECRKQADDAKD